MPWQNNSGQNEIGGWSPANLLERERERGNELKFVDAIDKR